MVGDALEAARRIWGSIKSLPFPPEIAPSGLWQGNHPGVVAVLTETATAEEAIRLLVLQCFTHTHRRDSPYFAKIINDYLAYLERAGTPLDSLPIDIQETRFTDEDTLTSIKGRRISTGFLYLLVAALKILKHTTDVRTVIELGGGYGGLARVLKLLRPNLRYVIIDLPISLCSAYLTLRGCFPQAKLVFVEEPGALAQLSGDFDFAFVPCQFIDRLRGLKFDLAVNMQSLSEMTEPAYARYMRLFQDELELRYFYNLNRFGPHVDGLRVRDRMDDDAYLEVSSTAMLDPHWRLRFWDLYRPDGSKNLLSDVMNLLEIIIERIPENCRDDETYKHLARCMFDEARLSLRIDDDWHRLMWDSIRYHPTVESVATYLYVLNAKRFGQAAAYGRLHTELTKNLPPEAQRVNLMIGTTEPPRNETITRLSLELGRTLEEIKILKERLGEA